MHELALSSDMIEAISEKMREWPENRVSRVVLEVGKDAAVFPDAMRFCFELCSKDTIAEGAILEIVETSGAELRIRELEVN